MSDRQRDVRTYVKRFSQLPSHKEERFVRLYSLYGCVSYQALTSLKSPKIRLVVEIGCGRGDASLDFARKNPDLILLAIDVYKPALLGLLEAIDQENLRNILVYEGDALAFLATFPASCLMGIHLFFPDPWPKKRHHKRRIIQTSRLDFFAHLLEIGAYFHMVTDWEDYAQWAHLLFRSHPLFKEENALAFQRQRIRTRFELKGLQMGHVVHDLVYRRYSF